MKKYNLSDRFIQPTLDFCVNGSKSKDTGLKPQLRIHLKVSRDTILAVDQLHKSVVRVNEIARSGSGQTTKYGAVSRKP